MRISEYKEAKLKIFERAAAELITESQRDNLLTMLEAKKGEDLTPEAIKNFFDQLKDKYPDLEDKIESLEKKINDSGSEGESDDNSDNKNDDDGDDKEVSEAALDLMRMIDEIL